MNAVLMPEEPDDRIKAMTTDELWRELEGGFTETAAILRRLGSVWRELESRGEDMTRVRTGIPAWLPLLAGGHVDADVFVRFCGHKHLMSAVSLLPTEQQVELMKAGHAPLAVFQGGEWTVRMVPLSAATQSQVEVIFDRRKRCVRSQAEQVAILSAPKPSWKPGRPTRMGKVVVDRAAGTVRIGRSLAPIQDVIGALRAEGVIP